MSNKHIDRLLAAKPDDFTIKFILDMFVSNGDRPSPLNTWDEIIIPVNHPMVGNEEPITTTAGIYLVNVCVLTRELIDQLGYINMEITKKVYDAIESGLSLRMIEDKITSEQYSAYCNRLFWLAFTLAPIFSPSLSYDILTPDQKVTERRDELFAQHNVALAAGDVATITQIEAELQKLAFEQLKEAAGIALIETGMKKPSYAQIKETTVLRGALPKLGGGFRISKESLAEGIGWAEYPTYANLAVIGTWHRSVATAKGGYSAKQVASAGQAISIGAEGTDCKTDRTLTVTLKRPEDFHLRYVVETEGLVLMTSDRFEQYRDKTVKLRTPMYCTYDINRICETCMGRFFRQTGIQEPSTMVSRLGTSLMQIAMSAFHDMSVKTFEVPSFDEFLS